MADPQFVPLPSDVDHDSLPAWPGTGTQPPLSQFTPLPPGAATQDANPPPQPWKGSILPISGSGSPGDWHWDPHGGILGSAIDAFKLPGDVVSGRQPTPYETGVPEPSLTERTSNLAGFISPAQTGRIATAAAVPTAVEIRAAADAGYAAARAAEMTIPASTIATKAQDLQTHLQDNFGLIPKTAPKTFDVLDQLAKPPQGAQANYIGLEAARRQLGAIRSSAMGDSDSFAAGKVIAQLDEYIDKISPEAATARANYAAGQRSNDLTGALSPATTGIQERAEASAAASGSGKNLDNALRQRVKTFMQSEDNVRGFSDDERAALNDFVEHPGFGVNTLRTVSNLLGGGGGLGRLASSAAGAYLGGKLGLGEVGVALGAGALPTVGATLKSGENALARRALGNIDEMVRSRAPYAEQVKQLGGPAVGPGPVPRYTIPAVPALINSLPATSSQIPQGLLGPWT
jgi:hypothetical protein